MIRSNLPFWGKKLGLCLAFCVVFGLIWAEAKSSSQMAVFQSGTNYSFNYPRAWKVFDGSNKGPDWLERSLAMQEDTQNSSEYTKFILDRVDSLYIRAAFFEDDASNSTAFIVLSTGGRFGPNDEFQLKKRFGELFLPPGYSLDRIESAVEGFNSMERMVINASIRNPESDSEIHFRSVNVNGNFRSYTFTLGGSRDDILRLSSVLDATMKSLDEDFPSEKGISGLDRWLEIILLVTFALMITWLIRRIMIQNFVLYRRSRRGGGMGFIPMFIVVLGVLVGFSTILVTCQNRKTMKTSQSGSIQRTK